MGNGLLKGALSGVAVGVILVAGVSILSQPRNDPAPPAPLPRVSSDTAGASDTPPPPQEPAPPEPAVDAADETAGGQGAEPAPPAPEPFDPPPPPESEPPATRAVEERGSAGDAPPAAETSVAAVVPPAVPPEAPSGPAVADAPPAPPAQPSVAAAAPEAEPAPATPVPPPTEPPPASMGRESEQPKLAILLLDTPAMPDLSERIGALPFPVTVALDPMAPEAAAAAARLTAAGAELLALDATGAGVEPLPGAEGLLVTAGDDPQLMTGDGAPQALPLIAVEGEAAAGLLDRAIYRAAQSGRAAVVAVPTPEFLRELADWVARQPGIRLAPLSETLAP